MSAQQYQQEGAEVVRATVLLHGPPELLDLLRFVTDNNFKFMILSNLFRDFEWMLLDCQVEEMAEEDLANAVGVSDAARYGIEHFVVELQRRGRLTPEVQSVAEGLLRRVTPTTEPDA